MIALGDLLTEYRSLVAFLSFATNIVRGDIAFVVNVLSRFFNAPTFFTSLWRTTCIPISQGNRRLCVVVSAYAMF